MEPACIEEATVEIVPHDPCHVSALVHVADLHTAVVPPTGAHVTPRTLASVFTAGERLWHHHYPQEPDVPWRHRVYVAVRRNAAVGCILVRWRDYDPDGHIDLLLADPAVPDAADRLLRIGIAALRAHGCASACAGSRNPIGVGWFGTPTTWPHLIDAYERAGFVCIDDWVIMVGRTDTGLGGEPPGPQAPDWNVLLTEHPGDREWRLEVYRGEELAAECDAWGIPPHLDDCPGFGDVITIEWIGVEEPYLRHGLATWLMRKQFDYHRSLGRTRVVLWTGPDNLPARRLYERLHFAAGPQTRVYEKTFP